MEEKEQKTKKSIFKRWWFWVIIIIVIIAIGSSSTNSSPTSSNISTRKDVTVVDFSTMSFEEIESWCTTNNLKCSKKEDYSDTVEKGSFVSQSIAANGIAHEGDTINITYSLGKEPSTEEKNALKKAESYSEIMHMSKQGIYNQLTSSVEGFTEESAQYAIDNINADWNANALEKAKTYQQTMSMSKQAIYNQLISSVEGFTEEEAQYAIDNLE